MHHFLQSKIGLELPCCAPQQAWAGLYKGSIDLASLWYLAVQ